MKQNCAPSVFAVNGGAPIGQDGQAEALKRGLGEVFLAALSDPSTVGLILNTDGTLWQERAIEVGHWSPVGTMTPACAETVTRTAAGCLPATFPLREVRLGQPRAAVTAKPVMRSSLACACCRPKPLEEAPKPLFRLCWRRVVMIRVFLKNAERDQSRDQAPADFVKG